MHESGNLPFTFNFLSHYQSLKAPVNNTQKPAKFSIVMGGGASGCSLLRTKKLTPEVMEKLKTEFNSADSNGNGVLELSELEAFLDGHMPELKRFSRLIMDIFGVKGTIKFEMFQHFYTSLLYIGEDETHPESLPMIVFSKMDKDNSYFISYKEIKYLCKMLRDPAAKHKVTSQEAKDIIAVQKPAHPEWGLSRDEFIRLFDSYLTTKDDPMPLDDPQVIAVYGSGANGMKQLGNRSKTHVPETLDILTEGLVCMSAGENHSVFVYAKGSVLALGSDKLFQIGMNRKDYYAEPMPVTIGYTMKWAKCGDNYTAYLTTEGKIVYCGSYCEGFRTPGQSPKPYTVQNKVPFCFVSGDKSRVCAIDVKGVVYLFNNDPKQVPRKAKLPLPAFDVAWGRTYMTEKDWAVAITVDGALHGFGDLNHGYNSFSPLPCGTGVRAKRVISYDHHLAVLTVNGQVYTCGNNDHGQLGTGYKEPGKELKEVKGMPKLEVVSVGVGNEHTIFVTRCGQVFACGNNRSDQLMIGLTKDDVLMPEPSTHIRGKPTYVVCGKNHSLLMANGAPPQHPGMKCFGIHHK